MLSGEFAISVIFLMCIYMVIRKKKKVFVVQRKKLKDVSNVVEWFSDRLTLITSMISESYSAIKKEVTESLRIS
ncbi:hypothetical protein BMS3Abin15_00069 [bacterium BMS3Abin15]|nr:hypothetical protein BMS3Abin15_00069 [bacterium BMS3Abin15]